MRLIMTAAESRWCSNRHQKVCAHCHSNDRHALSAELVKHPLIVPSLDAADARPMDRHFEPELAAV